MRKLADRYICDICGYITDKNKETCPACGGNIDNKHWSNKDNEREE